MGKVSALFRYPVKSMLGERLAESPVTRRGLAGDRAFALIDRDTGKVVSAKNPRLWRDLLTMSATMAHRVAIIETAEGTVRSSDENVDEVLSKLIGRAVHLTDVPPPDGSFDRARPDEVLQAGIDAVVGVDVGHVKQGTFFDFADLHLITTATLRRTGAEVRRFRPNIVVDVPGEGFVENDWTGRDWRIGAELVIRVVVPTPRCAVPTLAHGGLPRDPGVLRFLTKHNRIVPLESLGPQPCAGIYAQVVQPGPVAEGDLMRPA
ncbi:molybdenum cofactor biosysynthesis protein [Rhizocola hellebori]|uniref:Molybdenum cofactor biosysynthesis protein n=1 Tax=Rhizocola hellebori TaxID=1392758 RepID=A0A8J3QCH9_9ACTN|nr:MOSC N-terminal beta barrel domain-containing protein [Rhizocola hellebori]GIH08234.1 molybdenum cofactor biosysynthesis protein [Rhizocola hellebori]